MTQYLISFGAHAMDHIPDEDAPAVARAAHAAARASRLADQVAAHSGGSWPPLELTVGDFSRSARM